MALELMMGLMARNWGWIVLRGVVAIVFGVLAFVWPGITLAALVLVWGAYALSDGVLALVASFKLKDGGRPMWPLLLVGLAGILAGIAAFVSPGMTALVLLAFIAWWAIAMGIFQLIAAVRFRAVIQNELMLVLSALLSIVFGALMLARPGAGALAVVWLIGCYALLFGVLVVTVGFRLKGLSDRIPRPA